MSTPKVHSLKNWGFKFNGCQIVLKAFKINSLRTLWRYLCSFLLKLLPFRLEAITFMPLNCVLVWFEVFGTEDDSRKDDFSNLIVNMKTYLTLDKCFLFSDIFCFFWTSLCFLSFLILWILQEWYCFIFITEFTTRPFLKEVLINGLKCFPAHHTFSFLLHFSTKLRMKKLLKGCNPMATTMKSIRRNAARAIILKLNVFDLVEYTP